MINKDLGLQAVPVAVKNSVIGRIKPGFEPFLLHEKFELNFDAGIIPSTKLLEIFSPGPRGKYIL